VTSKIITEMIENRSEFSYCANSCNKFVSIQSCPPFERAGGNAPVIFLLYGVLAFFHTV